MLRNLTVFWFECIVMQGKEGSFATMVCSVGETVRLPLGHETSRVFQSTCFRQGAIPFVSFSLSWV